MEEFPQHSNAQTWLSLVRLILTDGQTQFPAGKETREVLNCSSSWSMVRPEIGVFARKLSKAFMYGEAAWILAGSNEVKNIAPFNKRISQYSDDGFTFFGAYGPKVAKQLPYVVQALKEDPSTRRAVLNIWRESPRLTKDYPCTLSLQWLIRDDQLLCFDTMRSSDIWWGVPYDVFNMSVISYVIWQELRETYPKLQLGHLYLTACSQHLYSDFYQSAQNIIEEADRPGTVSHHLGPNLIELLDLSDKKQAVNWREYTAARLYGLAIEARDGT